MNGPDRYDVIIVGAGPVGSAAAVLASRHHLRTLLVDETPDVFPLPRAIHFDADIMRILQFAGLARRVEAITRATTGGVHLGLDGEPIRQFRVPNRPGDLGWRPHYMFFQPEFDGLLRQAAAESPGVDLRFGWRCEGVTNEDDGACIAVRAPDGATETIDGRYVIAADGAASFIRKQLALGLSDYGFEEPWVIIDGQVPDPSMGPDHTIMWCDPGRPGTYVPGPARHRRWEFMLLPGETGQALSTPEGARSLVGSVSDWLDPEKLDVVRVAVYRFHALVAEQWRAGSVFLAGDAAHQTPPFYGQGMCHGLRDVRNLLWKVAAVLQGRADEALLDTYQVEREPHVHAIIEAAVANGRYICTLDRDVAAERDATLRARMAQGADVRSFREVIPGLTTGLLDPEAASEAVGLLMAQPKVRTRDGEERLLDDALGDGWAIVCLPDVLAELSRASFEALDLPVVELDSDVTEAGDMLERWFDEFNCAAAVIRPDRYVYGTAGDGDELAALVARLETAFRKAVQA
jgi:3-(3-hydroxy-phenyl)propionate hydroxylase